VEKPLGPLFLRVVRVFAEALFDEGDGVPGERLDWITREYGAFSAHVGAKTRLGFMGALVAIQLLPVFFVFVPLPFTWLSRRQRRIYLERLEASSLTFLVTAVKIPLSVRYFEHPAVVASLGYDGRPREVRADDEPHPRLARKTGVGAPVALKLPAREAR
jgi:hypothetical protein